MGYNQNQMVEKQDKLFNMRHSLAHILAAAVGRLYGKVKYGVGPVIEEGFYYDFDLSDTISTDDLSKIEAEMRKIINANYPFEKLTLSHAEAKKQITGQPYKRELLEQLIRTGTTDVEVNPKSAKPLGQDTKITFYRIGDFIDLCRGGHVGATGEVGAYKLDRVAGAYWRGSEKNPMLQRVYGVAYKTDKEVRAALERRSEAVKRDHKRLGRQFDLFFFDESAPGMPYWLPKGVVLINQMLKFWRRVHREAGYQEISAPIINKQSLYEISGHWQHYRDDMFVARVSKNEAWGLKPMNCPNAMVVYKASSRSYRELPLRLSDADRLHRHEPSGTLNGLLRAQGFIQDDAHIFVAEDQIKEEYRRILELVETFYSVFGLEYRFRLGTRPDKYMGDIKTWDKAETELKEILEVSKKEYFVEEGDGAFYGPKLDILMKDALGRDWQTGTIQLDFQIPRNFKLTYTDKDGKDKTPVTIHRVLYGSIERFLAILLEHTAGAFPIWLAPEQLRIVTLNDDKKISNLANEIESSLSEQGIRVHQDNRNESVSKKIHTAEMEKVPYTIVIGEKELKSGMFIPRVRKDIAVKHPELAVSIDQIAKTIVNESKSHVRYSSL